MWWWWYYSFVLLLTLNSALIIDELENWSLPIQKELISNPKRDFLDVDSASDLVPLTVTIQTETEPIVSTKCQLCAYWLVGGCLQVH